MDTVSTIGYAAACCTSISFFPQVYKCYKTKQTKDISLPMFVITTMGAVLWLMYGLMLHAWPIIITNAIVLTFTSSMLILKTKYG